MREQTSLVFSAIFSRPQISASSLPELIAIDETTATTSRLDIGRMIAIPSAPN
jgi:hypothetical protein